LLIKFAEALAVILIAVALVGSGILPIWGDILVILAVIASFVAIFK
jgi:Na+/phosphate symporter